MKTRTLFIWIMISGLLIVSGFSGSCDEKVAEAPSIWESYQSEIDGIQFNYPKDWQPWFWPFMTLSVYGFSIPGVDIGDLDKIIKNVHISASVELNVNESLDEYKTALLTRPRSYYWENAILSAEKAIEVGGNNGYELTLTRRHEGVNLKQKMIIFVAHERGYYLTCSAPDDIFSEYELVFNEFINSFVMPVTNSLSRFHKTIKLLVHISPDGASR